MFSTGLHPDVLYSSGDRVSDDLASDFRRRDDRERFGNERQVGNRPIRLVPFNFVLSWIEWIGFAVSGKQGFENLVTVLVGSSRCTGDGVRFCSQKFFNTVDVILRVWFSI